MKITQFHGTDCTTSPSAESLSKMEAEVHFSVYVCVYVCVCVDLCVLKGFELESFSLKYNHTPSEYKIHFVEVDLYYFQYI